MKEMRKGAPTTTRKYMICNYYKDQKPKINMKHSLKYHSGLSHYTLYHVRFSNLLWFRHTILIHTLLFNVNIKPQK